MKAVYPVYFTKSDEGILIEVPDFGILAEEKDMSDAICTARGLIEQTCVSLENANKDIPAPSELKALDTKKAVYANTGETVISFVDIDSSEYRRKTDTKTVRRNVALPSWLNYEADKAGVNVSRILQEALVEELHLERKL